MGFFDNLGRVNIGDESSADTTFLGYTKKEDKRQFESSDQRDFSTTSSINTTDSRSFSSVNAPTLVFNSAGANVDGARSSFTPTTDVSSSLETKKESRSAQAQTSTDEQAQGLLEGIADKGLLIAGIVGGGFLLLKFGGKK